MKTIIFLVTLFLSQSLLHAQDGNFYKTSFELQTAFNAVYFLGAKANVFDANALGNYNGSINDYTQRGSKSQLGILATRNVYNNIWFRSGIQFYYLESLAKFSTLETYDDFTDNYTNTNDRTINFVFQGLQIPLMFEQQYDFGKWKGYSNLGFSFSYASANTRNSEDLRQEFYFKYDYDSSCNCYPKGDPIFLRNPNVWEGKRRGKFTQYGAAGILGVGAMLIGRNGTLFRVGYAFLADLIPFHKGNNIEEKVYEIFKEINANHRHLFHQLEFSMVWPEKNVILKKKEKSRNFKGWFLGVSTSLQQPIKKRYYYKREGFGWGRYAQLKYISKIGLGARVQYGRWILPASYTATNSNVMKGELLYQFPFGVEFSAGYSLRDEYNIGGGEAREKGALLLGSGGTIPLNQRMGIMLDFSSFYHHWEEEEKFLMETSIGFAFRVFK